MGPNAHKPTGFLLLVAVFLFFLPQADGMKESGHQGLSYRADESKTRASCS